MVANLKELFVYLGYYIVGNARATVLGVRLEPGARVSPRAQVRGCHKIGRAVVGRDVVIGEGSYVSSGWVMSGRIGRWCSVGYDVLIGPTEHVLDQWTTSPRKAVADGFAETITVRVVDPPIIEDEVWIGARAVVLRGVRIGAGAVIAAGAVVVTDVPSMEVWGGVPAKRIAERPRVPQPTHATRSLGASPHRGWR